jgi:flagellar protein FlaF
MARRLDSARAEPDDKENIRGVVRTNWRIWTIIQSSLVDPECTIPVDIRSNLLNLSNFIDKRSADLIADPDVKKIEVLININRQIGAGLLETPENIDSTNDQDINAVSAASEHSVTINEA